MEPIRVILADDHAVVRQGTRSILEQDRGIQVVGEAADGREAIDLASRLRPDVAIIDVRMPGMNGIEATRAIKQRCPATGVLVLTAYDDDPYVFALLEAGAAGYLLKDVSASELAAAVRRVHSGEAVLHPAVARKVLHRFVGRGAGGATRPELSEREHEVLRLAARGLSNKEIARTLGLSPRTVQAHLNHIFVKLDVASRTEAVICGLRHGWLRLEDLE
ncbi:MAG TPA: response regulator transcription factor [Dehalococcoidia bacterium]|nr:response regulator transcription factor [Dehalococcoidia bacterium]